MGLGGGEASGGLTRRFGPVVASIAALFVTLSACGGSGYQYVSSSAEGTYFKVPAKWKVFDEEQVLAPSAAGADDGSGLRFLRILDASPSPTVKRELRVLAASEPEPTFQLVEDGLTYNWPLDRLSTADHPFGVAWVRELGLEERDDFSRFELRNEIVPLDLINDQELGQISFLSPPEGIVKAKGLAGTRLVYQVATEDGSFTVDQTGLVDPDHRLVYFFIAGCQSDCYTRNRSTITQIADSWTIKEP